MRVSENTLHVFPRSGACCIFRVRSFGQLTRPRRLQHASFMPHPACSSHRGSTQQVDIHLFAPAPERHTQAGSRALICSDGCEPHCERFPPLTLSAARHLSGQ